MANILEIIQTFNVKIALKNIFGKINEIVRSVNNIVPYEPSYKVYTALLNQTGISAPVATVLENTIGNIVWTRDDVGIYLGTLSNAFTINKTIVFLNFGSGNVCIINSLFGSADYVVINANGPDFPNDPIDVQGLMQIEIRVYN